MDWQQITQSFRGSFEGPFWAFALLILLAISLPIAWHFGSERVKQRRQLGRLRRRLSAKGIGPAEWALLESAIQSTCPHNPNRLLDSVSLFHTWVDGLPDIEASPPELIASLTRIKELAYPDGGSIFVPHSTRDLVPGASLNLVVHQGGQEVVTCMVTEVTMGGLRLNRRGGGTLVGLAGQQVSLFYPRPEAMYHAVVRVLDVDGADLRTSHTLQGHFKVRQLREFWRVDVDMELKFTVAVEPGQELQVQPEALDWRDGRLINLSGNGAAIVTRTPPHRGAHIAFSLLLPSRTLRDIRAEVLHVTPGKEMSRLHLVFRNLDPGDQELIIRNLFIMYREIGGLTPEPDIYSVSTRTVSS